MIKIQRCLGTDDTGEIWEDVFSYYTDSQFQEDIKGVAESYAYVYDKTHKYRIIKIEITILWES